MSNFSLTNLNILLPLLALALFIVYLIVFYFLIRKRRMPVQTDKIDQLYLKLREEIRYSIAPKFVELSIGVNDLVDLAVEVWRMEQRVAKSVSNLPEQQLKGLENSIQKLKRYISKYDIEIVDYKNQKYNDGLNLDILSVEKDPSLSEPTIKETVEPTVLCKGQVVRKAKIILINNK
jgi:molecular chaperone GrpE (heat shock protein)